MAVTLRPPVLADIGPIEALLNDSALPTEGVADILRTSPRDFVVAEVDGAIVGVGGLEVTPDGALLRSVAVRPLLRSAGVGQQVVEELMAMADRRLLHTFLLTTTADNWFPRFGFERVDRAAVPAAIGDTWEFKTGCSQTATAMGRTPGTQGPRTA